MTHSTTNSMTKYILIILTLMLNLAGLTACQTTSSLLNRAFPQNTLAASLAPNVQVDLQNFPNNPTFWQGNTQEIWEKLQRVPLQQLQSASSATNDPEKSAWLKLAAIGKQYSANQNQLITQLMNWRAANPSHPANSLFPANGNLSAILNTAPPKHITLLLPLHGSLASSGQAVRNGFLGAYYQSPSKNQQSVSFLDTSTDSVTNLYQKAIASGADTIVGPLTKENVQQLASDGSISVPTLALNYTDRSLPANFYEFGLSPQDEAVQVADKARQSNHLRALVIAPQDSWGQRVSATLISRWKAQGGTITDTFYFTPQTNLTAGIAELLHAEPADAVTRKNNNAASRNSQRRHDFDVIFLLAQPQYARQIVPLLKYYYANNVPIYSTSVISSGKLLPADADLAGVTFSDTPWALNSAAPGQSSAGNANRLYAVGRDAYLISTQLIRMKALPNFPLYGATGALTLTPQQKIYRRVAWTQINAGQR